MNSTKYMIEIMPSMIRRYYPTQDSAIKSAKIIGNQLAAEIGTSSKVYAGITKINIDDKEIRTTFQGYIFFN